MKNCVSPVQVRVYPTNLTNHGVVAQVVEQQSKSLYLTLSRNVEWVLDEVGESYLPVKQTPLAE